MFVGYYNYNKILISRLYSTIFFSTIWVHVQSTLYDKKAKNGHFRSKFRKKLLRRPPLLSEIMQESLSFTPKFRNFYLIKWRQLRFQPPPSTQLYYINFNGPSAYFFNKVWKFYLYTPPLGVPSHYICRSERIPRQKVEK